MKRVLVFAAVLFLVTCTTYDNALIYKKNFQPGTHPLLRFDGYYRDVNSTDFTMSSRVKPFFFYTNGSVFVTEKATAEPFTEAWIRTSEASGSWGNYKIDGDTIYLERFLLNANNYERIVLKGAISEGQIRWTKRKERGDAYQPVDYTLTFTPFSAKPDSTKNWIRTKKKYNK
jgi:hypothetical protein